MRTLDSRNASRSFSLELLRIGRDFCNWSRKLTELRGPMGLYLVTDDEKHILSMTLACLAGYKLDAVIVTLN